MRERARAFRDAFAGERALFCYAVKANSNLAVIRLFASEGLGADTVSGGEIARALAAGVPPQTIVYAGIAKTDDEIRMALATGILQFNVEFGAGAAPDRRAGGGHGSDGAGGAAGQSGRRCRHPREDQHRPQARQVRHPVRGGAGLYRLAAELEGHRAGRGASAHRLADRPARAVRGGLPARRPSCSRACEREGIPLRRLDLGGGFGVRYLDEPRVEAEALAGAGASA